MNGASNVPKSHAQHSKQGAPYVGAQYNKPGWTWYAVSTTLYPTRSGRAVYQVRHVLSTFERGSLPWIELFDTLGGVGCHDAFVLYPLRELTSQRLSILRVTRTTEAVYWNRVGYI
jgi:hypothetical protein